MVSICDFCNKSIKYIPIVCIICGVKMCDSCYNLTCGGSCRFISESGLYHSNDHPPMILYDEEKKSTLEDEITNNSKSYISLNVFGTTRSILTLFLDKYPIISYVAKITYPINKVSAMQIRDNTMNIITHSHSNVEYQLLDNNDVKTLLSDNEKNITCKSSLFTVLITEFLESLDYPEDMVKRVIGDLLSINKFKFITFRCIRSPYSISSSFNIDHIKGALIIWKKELPTLGIDEVPIQDEDERILRLKAMVKLFKEDIKTKYDSANYSMSITTRQYITL